MSRERYTQPQLRSVETSTPTRPAAPALDTAARKPERKPQPEREQPRHAHSHYCCELAAITNPEQRFDFPTTHGGMCERIVLRRERELHWYM